jgi:Amt family ammonium transporter
VSPISAIVLGALAAGPSYFGLLWRARTRLDDSLDVVAAHGLGGTVGALLTGVLAERPWGSPSDGLLFGNPRQLGIQAVAILGVAAYSALASWGLLRLVNAVAPLRVSKRDEGLGLDVSQHGEEAYVRGEGALLILRDALPEPPAVHLATSVSLDAAGSRS